LAILLVILLVGTVVRLTGWTGGGLYFDDAWVALPVRVPLGTALHMWLSAPGYTLLQRQWDLVSPDNMFWVKAPALLLGIMAPVVAFWLARVLRFADWIALVMAGIVAAEWSAIQYSVAVKPFELELIGCMVLLAMAETQRVHRTTRGLVALTIVSIGFVVLDTALFVVVVGVWVALALLAVLDRRKLLATIVNAALTGLLLLPLVLDVGQRVPPFDTWFFRWLGTLVGPPYTLSHLVTVLVVSGSGLAHGILATPSLPVGITRIPGSLLGDFAILVTVCEAVLLVILALPAVKACVRRRSEDPALRDLASLLVIAVAFAAYVVGKVPLGAGRTDLVVLPAILVLLASGLERLAALIRRRTSARTARSLGVTAAVVFAVGASLLAWDQRAWYPTQDVKALDHRLQQHLQPGDVVVLTFRNTYSWAYFGLSPYHIHFSVRSTRSLGIGYWVTFNSPHVLEQESSATGLAIPGLPGLPPTDRRLWLVNTTLLSISPSTAHPTGALAQYPFWTGATTVLGYYGWHPTSTTIFATGVAATLYTRT
jgi:hypothetical protein